MGFDAPSPIRKPAPSLDELKTFFKSQPHWVFLAGYFGRMTLLNDAHYKDRGKDEVSVVFDKDKVTVKYDKETAVLEKTTGDFNLHKNCRLVVWGGCNVFSKESTLLGGGFIKTGHFFERVKGKEDKPEKICDAWMLAAGKGYGGGDMEEIFRALDPSGQEWELSGGKIKRGRKIT